MTFEDVLSVSYQRSYRPNFKPQVRHLLGVTLHEDNSVFFKYCKLIHIMSYISWVTVLNGSELYISDNTDLFIRIAEIRNQHLLNSVPDPDHRDIFSINYFGFN